MTPGPNVDVVVVGCGLAVSTLAQHFALEGG